LSNRPQGAPRDECAASDREQKHRDRHGDEHAAKWLQHHFAAVRNAAHLQHRVIANELRATPKWNCGVGSSPNLSGALRKSTPFHGLPRGIKIFSRRASSLRCAPVLRDDSVLQVGRIANSREMVLQPFRRVFHRRGGPGVSARDRWRRTRRRAAHLAAGSTNRGHG